MFKTQVTGGVIAALAASTLIAAPAYAIDGSSTPNVFSPSFAKSGAFTWSISNSLNNTTVIVGDRAQRTADGIQFQLDAKDSRLGENGNGTLDFDGKVTYRTTNLEVEIDDVKVLIDGTTATITADYDVDEFVGGRKTERSGDNVVMGTFNLTENIDTSKPAFSTTAQQVTAAPTAPAELTRLAGGTPSVETAALNLNLGKINPLTPDVTSSDNDTLDTGDILEIVGTGLGILAAFGVLGALLTGPLKDALPFKLPF